LPVLFFNRAIPPALLALNLALKDWNLFSWPFPHQNHRTWGRVTFVAATHARTLCMEPRNHSRGSHRSLSLFEQQQQRGSELRPKSERIPDKSGTPTGAVCTSGRSLSREPCVLAIQIPVHEPYDMPFLFRIGQNKGEQITFHRLRRYKNSIFRSPDEIKQICEGSRNRSFKAVKLQKLSKLGLIWLDWVTLNRTGKVMVAY